MATDKTPTEPKFVPTDQSTSGVAGEAVFVIPAPSPRFVQVSTPEYPNRLTLLLHPDGRVTWQ